MESASALWGGVKNILEAANRLTERGHDVTVVAASPPPTWMALDSAFRQVDHLSAEVIPDADVVVGTLWSTVPFAASTDAACVHYCQGFEFDLAELAPHHDRIRAVYDLAIPKMVTSPHLAESLRAVDGAVVYEIGNAIDHDVMHPANKPSARGAPGRRVRVGVVGPYEVECKGIATALEAVELAWRAGLDLELVRITNTRRHPDESQLPFPVEFHERLPPHAMGEAYRSLDVFLAASTAAEGWLLPAIEAMACGIPCVLTDIPAVRNYAPDIENFALIADPGDSVALAEAVVVAGSLPGVADTLIATGLEVAARYRFDAHVDRMEAALLDVIAQHTPPAPAGRAEGLPVETPLPNSEPTEDGSPESGSTENEPAANSTGPDPASTDPAAVVRTLVRIANEAVERDDGPSTFAAIHAATVLNPRDRELRRLAVCTALESGALRAAEFLIDDAATRMPGDPEWSALRGHLAFAENDLGAAAEALERALAADIDNATWHNDLGVVRYRQGELEAAQRAFEQAIASEPTFTDALDNLRSLSGAPGGT